MIRERERERLPFSKDLLTVNLTLKALIIRKLSLYVYIFQVSSTQVFGVDKSAPSLVE